MTVRLEIDGQLATITLDRPEKLNALTLCHAGGAGGRGRPDRP